MSKYTRELGPLEKNLKAYPIKERVRWATEGHRELARRISKRLSITNKDAINILRVIGQEGADMAMEGWVFSIPHLAIFWTAITAIRKSTLPGYEGQMLGGNKRLKISESATLKRKIKEEKKREADVNRKPE